MKHSSKAEWMFSDCFKAFSLTIRIQLEMRVQVVVTPVFFVLSKQPNNHRLVQMCSNRVGTVNALYSPTRQIHTKSMRLIN